MSNSFAWIDDDASATYFELSLLNIPSFLNEINMIASKTYTRGLIVISIYCNSSIYFVVQDGEGEQPLLDIRFPDVSQHGQGLLIASYATSEEHKWSKLTLWHVLTTEVIVSNKDIPRLKTVNVSTKDYQQTYCIMKSSWDEATSSLSVHHDALFRFGSWCYSGRVQLVSTLSLSDIPFVIPALRLQQSRLDYLCDVNSIPTTSPYASVLKYVFNLAPIIEQQIINSDDILHNLIERLTRIGLGKLYYL